MTTVKSGKGKNTKGIITEDSESHIIYKNIKGMCVPLSKMFDPTKLVEIKTENFFPCVDKITQSHSYLLKQPDNTYKALTIANWRAILHGLSNNLRPTDKFPEDNRITAYDSAENRNVEICYWPDFYWESKKKANSSKKKTKESKVKKKGRGGGGGSGVSVQTQEKNLKLLSTIIQDALKDTPFDFLVKEHDNISTIPISTNIDQFITTNNNEMNTNMQILFAKTESNTNIDEKSKTTSSIIIATKKTNNADNNLDDDKDDDWSSKKKKKPEKVRNEMLDEEEFNMIQSFRQRKPNTIDSFVKRKESNNDHLIPKINQAEKVPNIKKPLSISGVKKHTIIIDNDDFLFSNDSEKKKRKRKSTNNKQNKKAKISQDE